MCRKIFNNYWFKFVVFITGGFVCGFVFDFIQKQLDIRTNPNINVPGQIVEFENVLVLGLFISTLSIKKIQGNKKITRQNLTIIIILSIVAIIASSLEGYTPWTLSVTIATLFGLLYVLYVLFHRDIGII
jgi:hypothetical protein